MTSVVP